MFRSDDSDIADHIVGYWRVIFQFKDLLNWLLRLVGEQSWQVKLILSCYIGFWVDWRFKAEEKTMIFVSTQILIFHEGGIWIIANLRCFLAIDSI